MDTTLPLISGWYADDRGGRRGDDQWTHMYRSSDKKDLQTAEADAAMINGHFVLFCFY